MIFRNVPLVKVCRLLMDICDEVGGFAYNTVLNPNGLCDVEIIISMKRPSYFEKA